jgi:hypothetical protein
MSVEKPNRPQKRETICGSLKPNLVLVELAESAVHYRDESSA